MTELTDEALKALLDDTTPGPWKLRKAYLDDDAVEIVPRKVRGKASPEVGSWAELATVQIEYTDSTPKANARLIAAAPDLARALLDARAERDRAVEAVRQMHHAVCGETGFAAAIRADTGMAYPWPALDLAEEIAIEVMRKDMGNG